jgi:hypothetical protein
MGKINSFLLCPEWQKPVHVLRVPEYIEGGWGFFRFFAADNGCIA